MPRPPMLPIPDREAIFNQGITYAEWLANPDTQSHGDKIKNFYNASIFTTEVQAALSKIETPVKIIAIAETWCGDVIRHAPLLVKMCEATQGMAEIRFISREDAPEFFIRFLTNGGESLPKFVFCSAEFTEVGNWGPMSETPRSYISEGKAVGDVRAAREKVSAFYKENGAHESTAELLQLIQRTGLAVLPQ